MSLVLYHYPRCSKSRAALALLEERGLNPTIRLYFEEPLDEEELKDLLQQLGKTPQEFIRNGESLYSELKLSEADDNQLISAMVNNPKLIERPVLSNGKEARIGRPTDNILDLI